MVASQRPHTQSLNTQSRCWNCEEAVHRLADSCPYCKKSLQVFHISPEDQVEAALYSARTSDQEAPYLREKTQTVAVEKSDLASLLLATATLSCAGILFVLAALIWIFSDGGSFTLEWPESMWRTFGAVGLLLLIAGSYSLSRVE